MLSDLHISKNGQYTYTENYIEKKVEIMSMYDVMFSIPNVIYLLGHKSIEYWIQTGINKCQKSEECHDTIFISVPVH